LVLVEKEGVETHITGPGFGQQTEVVSGSIAKGKTKKRKTLLGDSGAINCKKKECLCERRGKIYLFQQGNELGTNHYTTRKRREKYIPDNWGPSDRGKEETAWVGKD